MKSWETVFLTGFLLTYIVSCDSGSTRQDLDTPNKLNLSNSIKTCLFGQDVTVDGGAGTNELLMPPDHSTSQNTTVGFIDLVGGFAFEINGTDFDDNIIIWTNPVTSDINFAVEWVDGAGVWDILIGAVSAGEIADEAQDRGYNLGYFRGFYIRGRGGDDKIVGDGTGSYGILPGSAISRAAVSEPFFGQDITVYGDAGTNEVLMPPDQSVEQNAVVGFVDVPGGFAFEINGTAFDDNITIWTNPVTYDINFAVEWVDSGGTRDSLLGSVSMGEIAVETSDRGLLPGDFDGFSIKALDGDDKIVCDGSGSFGTLPGSVITQTAINETLFGQDVTVDGGAGTNELLLPPDHSTSQNTTVGFIDLVGGFAFEINGTDFDDNIIIWTNPVTSDINFAVEWVDGAGVWDILIGAVSAGEIADEAQDRGYNLGYFRGFYIRGRGGDDKIVGDGTGSYGILPGSAISRAAVSEPFFGQDITVYGDAGTNEVLMPPDQSVEQNAVVGFVDVPGGFAFEINGTAFDDNITIWTNPVTYDINFAVEWVDSGGTWDSLLGSVSMGEIAVETSDRGLLPGDFDGFSIKALDGDDKIVCDGSGSFGDLPGAPALWE